MIIAFIIYGVTALIWVLGIVQIYKERKTPGMRNLTIGDLLEISILAIVPILNTVLLLAVIISIIYDRFNSSKFLNKKIQDL